MTIVQRRPAATDLAITSAVEGAHELLEAVRSMSGAPDDLEGWFSLRDLVAELHDVVEWRLDEAREDD